MKTNETALQLGTLLFERLNPVLPTFAIVAEEGTTLPFAVYRRTGLLTADTKDRLNYEETATYEVIISAASYAESVELACKVKQTLEPLRGSYRGRMLSDVSLVNADEDFHADAFIQRLHFSLTLDY